MNPFRTGFGYDVHQLVSNRPLILGGVTIPSKKGALGHSDADVLLHAIADALLGAAALGDIGTHFPDTDPSFKNANSMEILSEVMKKLTTLGYVVGNIDSTVVLQMPRIQQFVPEIRENITKALETTISNISVKATTTEHLGFIGKGEGVAAYATVLIQNKQAHKV